MTRTATVTRTTGETDITIALDLDGTGACDISTGVGFFDHMLNALGRHSLIDLTVHCTGDTWVDDHHTVEDVGIAMGQALRMALGDKSGIRRFGDVCVPLDEALILASVDISGRGELYWDVPIGPQKVGTFDTELGHEFFAGFARDAARQYQEEADGAGGDQRRTGTFRGTAASARGGSGETGRFSGTL